MRQHIEETELKKSIDRVACAKFIVSEHSGTIENISYDNNLNSLDLDCLKMVLKKGDTFRLGELFGIGYIICSSNLTADAIEKTKKVLDGIKIEIS
ncbi:hypothetical protein [Cytobacillus firmus]|nr:hypothetical protein [Cytobacillus firmus]MBG9549570.1 hypothetical protein [Cytobacillus firmus]MBG9601135.1 hypothetical protein [Cytobacillus firmus]MED1943262.1 hypothetical protein [Cytobacillus firmus]